MTNTKSGPSAIRHNGLPLLAAAIILLWAAGLAGAAEQRPNVIVLLADDLGWGDIGCYGGPVKTPTLDSLAANGVRFTDFHSGCAVCSPSRATLMTGRHHIRTGVYHVINTEHKMHFMEREVTLAEVLKDNGYATVHLGKWHLGFPSKFHDKPTPTQHGFDYWFVSLSGSSPRRNPTNMIRNGEPAGLIEGDSCQIVVDEAISWLDNERNPDAPFFLNIWFDEPHTPIIAPDEIVSQYGALNDPSAIYSATIDNTDRAIARLVANLEKMGALKNTLIVYSSDNGSYRTDRGGPYRGTKGFNSEGGIRVPGIFYWPDGIRRGHVESEAAGLVDLLPTVCGLLRIDKPEGVFLDGSDLSPLLTNRGGEFARQQPLFWLLPTTEFIEPSLSIRENQYALIAYRDFEVPRENERMAELLERIDKLMPTPTSEELGFFSLRKRTFNDRFSNKEAEKLRVEYLQLNGFKEQWIPTIKSGSYTRYALYDLDKDPRQRTDVSAQFPEIAARLKKQMDEITASLMAEGPDWHLPETN